MLEETPKSFHHQAQIAYQVAADCVCVFCYPRITSEENGGFLTSAEQST